MGDADGQLCASAKHCGSPGRELVMANPKVRVQSFSVSLDGFGAGPAQDLQHPLGVNGPEMFDWFFHTPTFRRMHGAPQGETTPDERLAHDDEVARKGFDNV